MIAKRADAPYRARAHRRLAQDQGGADRRLRHRRVHGAQREPRPLRRAAARRHGGWHARLRRSRRHGIQRRAARRARSDARSDRSRRAACGPPVGSDGAVATAIPETKTTTWVEPVHVCEVRFREWTPDGVLRHPAFLRMRPDKDPRDCERQGTHPCTGERCRCERRVRNERAARATRSAARGKDHHLLQSQEDLLADGAIHEGRSHRLLPGDLAVDAAVPSQPPAGDDALPRRHRRQVVLSEGCAGVRAVVDRHDPDLERGHAARHSVLRLRRRRVAALRREPRLDPAAHLGQPRRLARAAGLVRDRSRSEGGALLRRDRTAPSSSARSASRSACRATSRRPARRDCTSCFRSAASSRMRSPARWASCWRASCCASSTRSRRSRGT